MIGERERCTGARAAIAMLLGAGGLVCGAAYAQGTPWKPTTNVEMTVPAGAGSALDLTARMFARIAQERRIVETPIVVANRPGGGQRIAITYISQRPADGHFISMSTPSLLTNQITGTSPIGYGELAPIAMLVNEYYAFAVRSDAAIANGRDLVQRFAKDVNSVSIGIANVGGTGHIVCALAVKGAGADVRRMKTVAFSGGAQATTALLGGHVELVASSIVNVLPHVQAGKLRVVAVTAPKRVGGALAQVPTWREQGLDLAIGGWQGVVGPPGMREEQIAYWEGVFSRIVKSEEWQRYLRETLGDDIHVGSAGSRKFMENEYRDLRGVFVDLGLAK